MKRIAERSKGFNEYLITDDGPCEFYIHKGTEKFTVFVDKEDIMRLIELDKHWCIYKRKDLCYAITNNYGRDENGKYKLLNTILLHRFVLNYNKSDRRHIDHINHNGLDCCKDNLRIVGASENALNRNGKNSNNKSGYRNVFWNSQDKRWAVTLYRNGNRIYGGQYKDVHEAGRVAQELREKYYGEYAGVS